MALNERFYLKIIFNQYLNKILTVNSLLRYCKYNNFLFDSRSRFSPISFFLNSSLTSIVLSLSISASQSSNEPSRSNLNPTNHLFKCSLSFESPPSIQTDQATQQFKAWNEIISTRFVSI
jgi:hypothetical protein